MGIDRDRFRRGEYEVHGRGSSSSLSSIKIIDPSAPAVQPQPAAHQSVPVANPTPVVTNYPEEQIAVSVRQNAAQVEPAATTVVPQPVVPVETPQVPIAENHFSNQITHRKAKEKRHFHPAVKMAGKVAVVALLFAASVGAGAYSTYRHDSANSKSPDKQVSQVKVSNEPNTSTSGVLGVSTTGGTTTLTGQGDGTHLRPSDPYYQYSETFKGGNLTISRQPLPEQYKTNPQALQSFANQINAKQSFSTTNWGMVYMFTSTKDTTQVLVFKNATKFVIIQSDKQHSPADWASFIDALKV